MATVPGETLPAFPALFLLACTSTLTIWSTDPFWDRIYACFTLAITGWFLLRDTASASPRFMAALLALSSWGFVQWTLGATEDRDATLHAALRLASWCATAWCAYSLFPLRPSLFIHTFAWTGFVLSILGVLAYYTSPGQILWSLPSPYPDNWGPFLSRNNFAQFLELTFPPALWLACERPRSWLYWTTAAAMLAAGLTSASRAGAVLLCLEALLVFWFSRRLPRKALVWFAAAALVLSTLAGAGTLLERFGHTFLTDRPELYRSSLAMIAARPWQGYGLGTFALVYPEFALFDSGYTIEHAHNDWLEWTTEGGLLYTSAWLLLVIPPLRRLRSNPWAVGLPALFVHALADFPLARTGIAAWAFLLLGALESTGPPISPRRTSS